MNDRLFWRSWADTQHARRLADRRRRLARVALVVVVLAVLIVRWWYGG